MIKEGRHDFGVHLRLDELGFGCARAMGAALHQPIAHRVWVGGKTSLGRSADAECGQARHACGGSALSTGSASFGADMPGGTDLPRHGRFPAARSVFWSTKRLADLKGKPR